MHHSWSRLASTTLNFNNMAAATRATPICGVDTDISTTPTLNVDLMTLALYLYITVTLTLYLDIRISTTSYVRLAVLYRNCHTTLSPCRILGMYNPSNDATRTTASY